MSDIGLTARQPVHRIGVDDDDAACRNGRQQRTLFASTTADIHSCRPTHRQAAFEGQEVRFGYRSQDRG
jgi:hypothetical protein